MPYVHDGDRIKYVTEGTLRVEPDRPDFVVNEVRIESERHGDLTMEDLDDGDVLLVERHWESGDVVILNEGIICVHADTTYADEPWIIARHPEDWTKVGQKRNTLYVNYRNPRLLVRNGQPAKAIEVNRR